ncbi:thioredoxin [Bacteroidota bacterium]
MKKIILSVLIIAGISFSSCGNAEEKGKTKDSKSETSIASDDIQVGKVTQMDKQMFIDKVMNFEKNKDVWVYEGDKPCIIDFYADWCKPCKLIAPIMAELAEEYKDEIYIYKVNTDQQKELSSIFGIQSIPAVLFVPMEGKPQMSTGALPKETFKQAIDNFLLKKEEEKK